MNNATKIVYDVCIIGGGPSGLTAAIYTARSSLNTLVFCGNPPGGQLTTTSEVENFPGQKNGINGLELIESMREQAKKFSAQLVDENIISVQGTYESGFTVHSDSGEIYHAKAIIVATGASAKWLEIESEKRLRGKGVSACATCDGFFYKNKIVAVVGGGDAAMEEALFLTKYASKVFLIVRKTQKDLRASKIMQERAFNNNKIEFLFGYRVEEVLGSEKVSGLKVVNTDGSETKILDSVEGLFVAIGHVPNTDFLKDFIDLDEKGYVVSHDNTQTSKKGVFVSGDVSDHRYRQAVTAAGFGCMAAIDADRFLSGR